MACKVEHPSPQEISNRIKTRDYLNILDFEQSAETSVSMLDRTTETIEVQEQKVIEKGKEVVKPVYTVIETGIYLAKRVSEKAKKIFRRYKSEEEIQKMSQLPDNIVKRDGGIYLHALAQEIVEDIVYGKKKNRDRLRKEARSSDYNIKTSQFDAFYVEVGKVVEQIYAQQEKINSLTGEKGKVTIRTEQIVIDPIFDIGGTIDLLAVFSDNTASIYDWKSMTPYTEYTTGYGQRTKIVKEFIPFGKEETFRIQIQEYKRILLESYGIAGIRQTRVIPIHVQYKLKNKTTRKAVEAGNYLTGEIDLLETGEKSSDFLQQLPIGFEKTGYAELDKFVQSQLALIEKLKSNQKEIKGDRDRWQAIQNKIQRIKTSTIDIILKQDFIELYSTIEFLTKDFNKNGEKLTQPELHELRKEFAGYAHLIQSTDEWLEDLTDPKKKKKILDIIKRNAYDIQVTLGRIDRKILDHAYEGLEDEAKDSSGKLKAQAEDGFLKRTFGRLSEFTHPIFKKFKELKDLAIYKKRQALLALGQEIEDKQNALFNWGKNNGYNKKQTFDLLINPETGNLYSHLDKEFWEIHNKAFKEKDIKWIKEVYEFKDTKEWKKEYEKRLKQQKAYLLSKYNNLKVWKGSDGTVYKTVSQLSKEYSRDLKRWEKDYNLEKSNIAWLNQRNSYHLKLKEEVVEDNYSAEYKRIRNNKPLLEFYEMFEKHNGVFRQMLGLNYKELPPNFLPNIRREMMERMIDGGFDLAGAGREFINSLNVREEDEFMGFRDPETGEIERKIPKLYVNRFFDADGKVNLDEKSFDLGRTLYLFGEMAYNYKYMEEIEAQTMGLKLALEKTTHLKTGTRGKLLKNILGERAELSQEKDSNMYKLFESFTDYYLYGIKYKEQGKTYKILGKEVNSTKAILAAKNYFGMKVLGFAIIPGTAAWIAGRTAAYLEAKKGITYTEEHLRNTMKMWATDRPKYTAITKYFDIHVEDMSFRRALELTSKKSVEWLNSRSLFSPLRKADENIDNHVLVSMSQNYGFDKDGNLKRLTNLPKGTKSIADSFKVNEQTGEISVEGITQNGYIAFRNAARATSVSIKGALSEEDTNFANLNIWWNLAMQFKTWMPGLYKERFGKLYFDETVDAARYGRYQAVFSEFQYQDGMGVIKFIANIVIPTFSRLSFDIITFGLANKAGMSRVNKQRARLYYNKWRIENPIEAKKMADSHPDKDGFEVFLEIKHAQIKASLVEARVMLGFLALLAFMGAEGDDGEPRYMKTWLGRTLYKTLNRAHSEIVFALSPAEFSRLAGATFPLAGLFEDVIKTLKNTIDVGYHAVTGIADPYDRTPFLYYSSQWMIGMSQIRRLVEMYEQDKRSPF